METMYNALPIGTLSTRISESNTSNLHVDLKPRYSNTSEDVYFQLCEEKPSSFNKLQPLQWAPSEGITGDTIMIILKQTLPDSRRGSLKMVFGQLPVKTLYCDQLIPSGVTMLPSTNLVTLIAKVPDVEIVQPNSQNKILISVYSYDFYKHNMVVGSCTIGTFTYHDNSIQQPARTRTTTTHSFNRHLQRWPSSIVTDTEGSSIDQPVSQPCGSFGRASLDCFNFDTLSQRSRELSVWNVQQLQLQQKQKQQRYHQKELGPEKSFNTANSLDDLYRQQLTTDSNNVEPSLGCGSLQGHEHGQSFDTNDTLGHNYPRSKKLTNIMGDDRGSTHQTQYQTDITGLTIEWTGIKGSTESFNTRHENQLMKPIYSNSNNYHPFGMESSNYRHNRNHHTGNSSKVKHTLSTRPFAGMLMKTNLIIYGDLMDMTYKWTANEWYSCRRLVRFWRRQSTNNSGSGHQVECGFEPIEYYSHQRPQQQQQHIFGMNNSLSSSASSTSPALDRLSISSPLDPLLSSPSTDPNIATELDNNRQRRTLPPLVVSCIYWSERDDYFITSVDCICLLEGLIGVQFSVEEKNRIRRNLEGFRPLTVSKCRADCADFFKLIMDFPHPKPRNIEKDVKVFAWKSLPQALRKIFCKYTSCHSKIGNLSVSSSPMLTPQAIIDSTSVYQPMDSLLH